MDKLGGNECLGFSALIGKCGKVLFTNDNITQVMAYDKKKITWMNTLSRIVRE